MSKVILTDCDEVLFDWCGPFQKWVRDNYPHLTPDSDLTDHWHVEAWLNCDIEFSRQLIRDFNANEEFWPYFDTLPHVEDVVLDLHSQGWKFVAITACAEDYTTWEGRWNNLNSCFGYGVFDSLHCVGLAASKAEVLARYRPTYWVEDKMKHAKSGADLGHKSFLINYKHNEKDEDPRVTRVLDWRDIREHIRADSPTLSL